MSSPARFRRLLFGTGERPYPAFVPQSVKVYPLHQLLPTMPAPAAGTWDPTMRPDTAAYLAEYGSETPVGRQLYMHIPFCPAFCHFCCLYKTMEPGEQGDDFIERFVQSLLREITYYGGMAAAHTRPVTSIYFGGGTPTMLKPSQVERIVAAIYTHLPVAPTPEVTFEGMAHQLRDRDYLRALCANGVNRISFGVQTFHRALRQQLGRLDTVEDILAANAAIRAQPQIRDLNFELLIGLPNQDLRMVADDIAMTVQAAPDSTDVLFYNAVPGTRYYDMIRNGRRPPQPAGDALLEMRRQVVSQLTSNGYHHATGEIFDRRVGHLDNFNETHYGGTSGLDEMLALGPSAYGLLEGTLYQNVASVGRYMECVQHSQLPIRVYQALDSRHARRRALLFGLQLGVIRRPAVSVWQRPLVASWTARGLLHASRIGWVLSDAGKLWYNMMQMEALPLSEAHRALDLAFDRREQRRLLFHPREATGNVALARQIERLIEGPIPLLRGVRRTGFRIMNRLSRRRPPVTFAGPPAETTVLLSDLR